jgi:hypothetical protein
LTPPSAPAYWRSAVHATLGLRRLAMNIGYDSAFVFDMRQHRMIRDERKVFSAREKELIAEGSALAAKVSARATAGITKALDGDAKERARAKLWFGDSDLAEIGECVLIMNEFFESKRLVTFVDRRKLVSREVVYQGPGKEATFGQVEPMTWKTYAEVKCLSEDSEPFAAHVGSGLRLALGERFFHPSKSTIDRANTVYHELSHKLLKTVDHEYGAQSCLELARRDPQQALWNADNWSWYAMSFLVPDAPPPRP